MKQSDNFFVIVFSFLFPLTLIGWAIRDSLNEIEKKVEVEGLLYNLVFLLMLVLLKYLSLIPFIGVVFSFFFPIFLWLYLIFIIVILIIKSRDIERELPFISFYAERIKGE